MGMPGTALRLFGLSLSGGETCRIFIVSWDNDLRVLIRTTAIHPGMARWSYPITLTFQGYVRTGGSRSRGSAWG
jgi:hypothetical protein